MTGALVARPLLTRALIALLTPLLVRMASSAPAILILLPLAPRLPILPFTWTRRFRARGFAALP